LSSSGVKRVALLSSASASFLTPFMGSSINVALPTIGEEFAIDAVMLNWVATSFLLAAAMFLVPFGKIADIYGRKKIFINGILIFTISSFLCGISLSGEQIILLRFLQGIGSAMIFGTGIAILTSVYPPAERGKALGINVASVYTGLSLGPFLGGILTHNMGWRSIFFAIVPIGLIVILITLWKLRGEWAEAKGEKFDLNGSIIYGVSLLVLILGFSLLPGISGIVLLILSVIGIAIFVIFESKKESPVLEIRLFRHNSVFAFSNFAALINYSSTFAVVFLLSLYLQYIKGLNPQRTGMILLAQPVVMALLSPLAGWLSDRIEPRVVASAGMTVITVALSTFAFIEEATPVENIIAGLVVLGLGFALFSSPNTNAIMGSVERKFYGVASAMVGTMRLVGQMLSMGIAMMIFAIYIGRVQITSEYFPQLITSVRVAFTVFAALCFIGIFLSLARGKLRD